jgi:hypothetical protein
MNRVSLAILLSGFSLVVTGATLIYHPLGFLVAGSGMIIAALASTRKAGK